MKLNKVIINNVTIILLIILVSLYHYFINNGLEKLFFETYVNSKSIKRPLEGCLNNINGTPARCTGMPSGHCETITIFALLLYLYKFIPLWLCIILIIYVSIQRIVTKAHTLLQVLVGIIIGCKYSFIYKYYNLSFYSFLIIIIFGFVMSLIIIYKLDKEINQPIPSWVDPQMMESIKKKKKSPLYTKIGSIYINSLIQERTFVSWNQLESYLDIIVERIKLSGENFDAVVGIKTGGAIISDYISLKLGLPNYKIKLSRTEYNCDKKPYNAVNDIVQKHVLNKLGEYTICEGINDNLEGKNIILIDELVSSGKTMVESYNYLKNEKHVNNIYPTAVAFHKKTYKSDLYINYVICGTIMIWPWGYDN